MPLVIIGSPFSSQTSIDQSQSILLLGEKREMRIEKGVLSAQNKEEEEKDIFFTHILM